MAHPKLQNLLTVANSYIFLLAKQSYANHVIGGDPKANKVGIPRYLFLAYKRDFEAFSYCAY